MNDKGIIEIIERGLKVNKGSLTVESSRENVGEWDSLGHLGILIELDQSFSGKVAPIEEMANANSVEKIIQILREHSLVNAEIV
ncbi:MAG: acyl carrier protein [Exilibacterium sp.]